MVHVLASTLKEGTKDEGDKDIFNQAILNKLQLRGNSERNFQSHHLPLDETITLYAGSIDIPVFGIRVLRYSERNKRRETSTYQGSIAREI